MRTLQRRLVRVAAAAVAVVGWGAVLVAPTGASAAIVTTPLGLSPGAQYRLAFVTTTGRDATSSDIADYNDFVTLAADSQADLFALGATWKAIGSTSSIDARDNTGTNPSFTGVPIYLLDGTTKIADNNADLWDGTIDWPINIQEDGSYNLIGVIWTGTNADGMKPEDILFLGATDPSVANFGSFSLTDSNWVTFDTHFTNVSFRFYAISSQLTVAAVPLPGALILFGSGLACLAVLRRRNRSLRPA